MAKITDIAYSNVERILDLLSRPQRAVAGGVRAFTDEKDQEDGVLRRAYENLMGDRQDDFTKVVKDDFGVEGLKGDALGLGLDVLSDPLNLIGVGAVKGATKASRAGKIAKEVGEVVKSKVPMGIKTAVRQTFSPTWLMPENLAREARLSQAAYRTAPERVVSDLVKSGRFTGDTSFKTLDLSEQTKIMRTVPKELVEGAKVDPEVATKLQTLLDNTAKEKWQERLNNQVRVRRDMERAEAIARVVKDPTAYKGNKILASEIPDVSLKALERAGLKGPESWAEVPEEFVQAMKIQTPYVSRKDNKIVDLLGRGTDAWRAMATKWRPSFHVKNLLGNMYNVAADTGGNPFGVYSRGNKYHKGIVDSNKIGGFTHSELQDAFSKYDIDRGLSHHIRVDPQDIDETARSVVESLRGPSTKFGKLEKAVDTVTDPIEKNARVGVVLKQLEKFAPEIAGRATEIQNLSNGRIGAQQAMQMAREEALGKAMIQSKDTMFDYRELAPFQRAARAVMPFATFTTKNLPLQLRSLVKNPHVPAKLGIVMDDIERMTEEKGLQVPREQIPDWLRDTNATQLPFKTKQGNSVFMQNPFPVTDLNLLDTDTDTAQQLAQMLHPGIKAAVEVGLGKQLTNLSRDTFDERGRLGTPVQANSAIQSIPRSVGERFMTVRKNATDPSVEQYEIPFLADYAMRQVPVLNSYGRATQGLSNPSSTKEDPLLAIGNLLGLFPAVSRSPQELQRTERARKLEASKQKGIERKQRRRTVRREDE